MLKCLSFLRLNFYRSFFLSSTDHTQLSSKHYVHEPDISASLGSKLTFCLCTNLRIYAHVLLLIPLFSRTNTIDANHPLSHTMDTLTYVVKIPADVLFEVMRVIR